MENKYCWADDGKYFDSEPSNVTRVTRVTPRIALKPGSLKIKESDNNSQNIQMDNR